MEKAIPICKKEGVCLNETQTFHKQNPHIKSALKKAQKSQGSMSKIKMSVNDTQLTSMALQQVKRMNKKKNEYNLTNWIFQQGKEIDADNFINPSKFNPVKNRDIRKYKSLVKGDKSNNVNLFTETGKGVIITGKS